MDSTCDNMMCRMKRDINEDPMYWLGAAFFSGILFATWSWGILYLLFYIVFYEVFYYIVFRCRGNLDNYCPQMRIGLSAGAILGFLIGRCITQTDNHEETMGEFLGLAKYYLNIPK